MHERLKRLRKELNLTQQEFADKIHVSRGALATYETGRNEPIDAIVALICQTFHVNENWLRNGKGDIFVQTSRSQEIAEFVGDVLKGETDTFKRRFVAILARLDESDWVLLEKMVEEMKKD